MAILKSVVNVNNGNTGWTKKDVIDALETAFANLGFHGGTNISGVPQACASPGSYEALTPEFMFNNGGLGGTPTWRRVGGTAPSQTVWINRYFYVTNNGTSDYRVLEEWAFTSTSSSVVDLTNNQIVLARHGLVTGDAVTWAPGATNANLNIGGLTLNTVYYVIKVTDNAIKLAANSADATAGTAIDLTALATTSGARFRRVNSSTYANYTITVLRGDRLNFTIDDTTSGGTFNLCGNVDSYTENRKLDASAFSGVSYQDQPTGNGTSSIVWDTGGWRQSESEALKVITHPSDTSGWGVDGTIKYIYANSVVSAMKGEIVVLPCLHNDTYFWKNYWKYTVPASGGRSELKLRVWRQPNYYDAGYVVGVTIHSIGNGWTSGDTFTIPGNLIGGTTPANDIKFGININETSANAGDGTASIAVTTLGAGSNFFQKHYNGYYAVLKNVNDATKTYGTTYYTFATNTDNDYYLNINSGSGWHWLNVNGTNHGNTSASALEPGYFLGRAGLDLQNNYNYISRADDSSWGRIQYASTATPTAYPLSIRVYRAQAPQDSNFAIIQFTQTINGTVVPYGAFTIHRGATFGSSVFNLDHVYLDSYTEYSWGGRSVETFFRPCGYYQYQVNYEPADSNSKARAASYGWFRDTSADSGGSRTRYTCNIDTDNRLSDLGYYSINSELVVYYRNSTYDKYGSSSVSPSANYYKPVKGLPIDNNLVPCPYFMPDDFVVLQVATTPGLTQFRPGDTITISASEVYEIIFAGYQQQQNGLDNINNNSTIGMLFMARTT